VSINTIDITLSDSSISRHLFLRHSSRSCEKLRRETEIAQQDAKVFSTSVEIVQSQCDRGRIKTQNKNNGVERKMTISN
jgi:hypothetical protein